VRHVEDAAREAFGDSSLGIRGADAGEGALHALRRKQAVAAALDDHQRPRARQRGHVWEIELPEEPRQMVDPPNGVRPPTHRPQVAQAAQPTHGDRRPNPLVRGGQEE
jgi:hypothetical protein